MNQDGDPLLFSIPPQQFALISALIGVLLSFGLDVNRQNSLGYFFLNIGNMLQSIAGQTTLLQGDNDDDQQLYDKINDLKQQICLLEQEVSSSRLHKQKTLNP